MDAGREGAGGSLYVIVTDEFTSGPFRKYATDSEGNRTDLLTTVPDFDALTRSWYSDAVEKGDATWSNAYVLFTGHDMAIAASRPVYDERQNLLGVVSVDVFVSHISDFMKNLEIGEIGSSFIVERSGLLIASSTDEKPFTDLDGDEAQRRLYASESTTPIIRHAAESLTEQLGDYYNITGEQQFEFEIDGQRQFLQVAPVQDEYGIDWLIVVVIPESDFMAQINANNRATAFLIGAALIIAIVAGVITAQWVTRPILRLNASTQALARGEWDQTTSVEWIGEIDELARSFDNMVGQLKQTLEGLTSEIAERRQVEEALQESEERYRTIFETAGVSIWEEDFSAVSAACEELQARGVTNLRRYLHEHPEFVRQAAQMIKIVDVNETTVEMFGATSKADLLVSLDRIIVPETLDIFREEILAIAEGRTYFEGETVNQTLDGKRLNVLLTMRIPTEAKKLNRVLVSLMDVTERKRLEKQLHRHERLAAVGQLAAGIAHDFRNRLTVIMLHAQMPLRKPGLPLKLAQNFEIIVSESNKAANLVQQILDFSSRAMIEVRSLDLKSLTQEVTDILRRTIPENVRLTLTTGMEEYIVQADPARVQQALTNLALNSRDAMPRGGELRIELSKIRLKSDDELPVVGMPPGDWVCLAISDTGMGMTEKVRAHLFEPFFTTKEVGKGTGLGLAQVYGIIRQHEGYIGVETEVGEGTTFRIYLPASGIEEKIVEDETAAAPQGQGETILLVGDNEGLRKASQELLEWLGYRALTAANGREALEVYEEEGRIDLVITDAVMPEMGGKELVQELRSTDPNLKALGITGYTVEKVAEELKAVGFLDVIHKPFEPDDIARTIRRALDAD